ncbi:MAG: thermonuclease family protein [Rhodoblastus sp.]|nr:MAG: thermonuclease family protein [Rhodoblastus sp.]
MAVAASIVGALASSSPPAPQDVDASPSRVAEAGRRARFPGPYPAHVVRIVDGDTFQARVAIWFGQEIETLVRLRGVDAPERAARCATEADGADRAAQALADLLSAGRVSLVGVTGDKYFGRVVADVVVSAPDGGFPPTEVGPALLAQGVARRYDGGRREGWCALREARAAP